MDEARVRMLTWNLLHGGSARRMPEIALGLLDHAPDIAVLTEFRPAIGGQVAGALADHGLTHQARSNAPPDGNGVLIASRFPLAPAAETGRSRSSACPLPAKWLEVGLPHFGLRLAGVHIPDGSRPTERTAYWRFLVEHARTHAAGPCVVMGDFNSGRHRLDEPGSTFTSTALLGTFCTLGFHDAYRLIHPDGRDASWTSHTETPFRLDHAFVSTPLASRVMSACYSHAERATGASDHSALVIEMLLAIAHNAAPAADRPGHGEGSERARFSVPGAAMSKHPKISMIFDASGRSDLPSGRE